MQELAPAQYKARSRPCFHTWSWWFPGFWKKYQMICYFPQGVLLKFANLVVREKSLTLLQALRAEAMMGGSGTKSIAQRSPIPWLHKIATTKMDSWLGRRHSHMALKIAKLSKRCLAKLVVSSKTNLPDLPAINVCSVEVGNVPESESLQTWNSDSVVKRSHLASNSASDSCVEDISLKEGAAWPGRTCIFTRLAIF